MLFFIMIIVIILYYRTYYKSVDGYRDYTSSKNYQELDKPEIYPYEQVLKFKDKKITDTISFLKKLDPCDLIMGADNTYCMVENITKFDKNGVKCHKKLKSTDLVNKKYKEYFMKYSCINYSRDQTIFYEHRELDKKISWTKVQTELIDDIVKYRRLLLKTDRTFNNLQNVHSIVDIKDLHKDLQKERKDEDTIGKISGSCFSKDNKIVKSVISEEQCKEPFIWSTRCISDKDCSFANKNYNNKFGSCNYGYCGIPLGIKQKGYNTDKSMISDLDKAECHNCDNKFDKHCCKEQLEQLDKTKMKSPDYAYTHDRTTRLIDNMKLAEKDLKVSTIFLH